MIENKAGQQCTKIDFLVTVSGYLREYILGFKKACLMHRISSLNCDPVDISSFRRPLLWDSKRPHFVSERTISSDVHFSAEARSLLSPLLQLGNYGRTNQGESTINAPQIPSRFWRKISSSFSLIKAYFPMTHFDIFSFHDCMAQLWFQPN